MWPFLSKQKQAAENPREADDGRNVRPRPMKFSELVEGMGDFRDLGNHDIAMKFWLPEPALEALRELCSLNGDSVSESLRQLFATHCYGIYAFQFMNRKLPGLFKDPGQIMFSRGDSETPPGKKRVFTYWVPELGKNVMPVKVWVPVRMRDDLQILAAHVDLSLSQYVREIVISRLLGHGTLPFRPEMLKSLPLPAADDWCNDKEVAMREVDAVEARHNMESKTVGEWVDE
jgi:hypothetical protein